jgi:hypothetical protein
MTLEQFEIGFMLPWKTVRDVITGSLQARFTELVDGSARGRGLQSWPRPRGRPSRV